MILVTGATGTVGREVVAQLLEGGQKVRALTRDPSKAKLDPKVEVVAGDTLKPETLTKAVQGVESVFAVAIGAEGREQDRNIARAAKAAGARVVKLSVLGAEYGAKGGIFAGWHAAGEAEVKESGAKWTFVRPGAFMSNVAGWAGMVQGGAVYLPWGDGKLAMIHPKDIAAVAVKALTSPAHEEKAYSLTGPEALSAAEYVKILSDAIGKPVKYVNVPDDAAKDSMLKMGMPAQVVEGLLQLAALVRSGGAAQVSPDFEKVTGKKGRTFAEWARENAAAFR